MKNAIKIRAIAAADNFYFLKDVANFIQKEEIADFKCISAENFLENHKEVLRESDILWLEWFDGIIFKILTMPKPNGIKYILRCHRYELFSPRTVDMIYKISSLGLNSQIDKMVFVSHLVQEIGVRNFTWMDNSVVIPNLIDHSRYELHDKGKGHNLLFVGRISYVKNIPLLLTFFKALYNADQKYHLHIVGDIDNLELKCFQEDFITKSGLQNNVKFYGKLPHGDVIKLMHDMHYIICTSIFESQGMGIIEGMCKGLKPIIFSFPGAEYIFPKEYLFTDIDKFLELILYDGEYEPEKYRNFVIQRYSIKNNINMYETLIREVKYSAN